MAYRIGLTGNIGCGKSSVGKMLAELGAEYIDADQIVHELYRPGTPESERILDRFGPSILGASGEIDRRKLAEIVFRDPSALRDLEALLHPSVRARIRQRVASTEKSVAVIDAIKLFESGLVNEVDVVWVVTCTPEQQEARLMKTRGYSREEARLRIEAQPPQAEKVKRANVVIDNSGSLEATRRQVKTAWQKLLERLQSTTAD